jgi:hypothetical protein
LQYNDKSMKIFLGTDEQNQRIRQWLDEAKALAAATSTKVPTEEPTKEPTKVPLSAESQVNFLIFVVDSSTLIVYRP